ncbi:ubiquinol oxidase 1a, mitochondrial isoform X1 [Triticum aestivum]|uniref:ubiquinol oxidase 1a, mitochondrial isoform X1 n=1 Tax=Triticum aestivum TaxID=4565 RepID=UPI001D00247B|nr:ubiquinol oxidase 1a, mitochondrial-like isoform X1 [Triticum aestivum]
MVRRRRWRSAATWGIEQSKKLVREEGTEWKWSCFRLVSLRQPWEAYSADMSIDLTKHHVPNTMLDKIAYYTVKSPRFPTDIFFQLAKKIQLKERQPSYLPEKDLAYSAWMLRSLL